MKTVETLLPIDEAPLLTYRRLSGRSSERLMNFSAAVLEDGWNRIVDNDQPPAASARLGSSLYPTEN
jgi:hypothetical protein